MQIRLFSTFLTLILISILFSPNTFAQDSTQWELPEGATARLGKGGINGIQYSPDNRFFAVASTIGIWLYDAATYREAALFTADTGGITCMALSPDGRTLPVNRQRSSQDIRGGSGKSPSVRMGKPWRVAVAMARCCYGSCPLRHHHSNLTKTVLYDTIY